MYYIEFQWGFSWILLHISEFNWEFDKNRFRIHFGFNQGFHSGIYWDFIGISCWISFLAPRVTECSRRGP